VFWKTILNIHMYSGLLCFSFLLIFGISVLIFNHPFDFTRTPGSVTTWTQELTVPALAKSDGQGLEEKLRMVRQNNALILNALKSFAMPSNGTDGGWTDHDTYHARFVRPGKEYDVDFHPSQHSATITRSRMSFWRMTTELHMDSYVVFSNFWRWYVELCTIGVIVAGVTGIYLWPARARERRIGIILLGLVGSASIALMLFVSLHG
jgi:hypothetical protein